MFQIPLRIGKHNNIVDNISDFGGNTDRGMPVSGRSFDEFGANYDDKFAGTSSYGIFNRKNDIIETESNDELCFGNHEEIEDKLGLSNFKVGYQDDDFDGKNLFQETPKIILTNSPKKIDE